MTITSRYGFHPTLRLALALALAPAVAEQAAAATFMVTNLANSGPGSLRQAVLAANAAGGADEIAFEPGLSGTITLTSGEIAITDHLVITGPGAEVLTVSGNHQTRIFLVDNGAAGVIDVTLSGLTLTQGYAEGPGGAVLGAENLTIRSSVISDSLSDSFSFECGGGNIASSGGALRIEFSTVTGGFASVPFSSFPSRGGNICAMNLTLERSTVSGGEADLGGGFYGIGSIYRSTISGNNAMRGGGIYGTPTIDASTVIGNFASDKGGGIFVDALGFDGAAVINSTISGNSARIGGGIFATGALQFPGFVLLQLTTFSNNTALERGGSLARDFDFANILCDHSILANGSPQDVHSGDLVVFETNYCLIETTDEDFDGFNNIVGVDPLLGPLADNGGPTLTHALLPGSPAIDAGDPAIGSNPSFPDPPATDQRGFARIAGPAIDLGSIEAQEGIVQVPTLSQVGLLVLSALLLAIGMWRLRSSRNPRFSVRRRE